MRRKLIISDDGSHTIMMEDMNEHYHSTYGALSESSHVFIEAGLEYKLANNPQSLNILEVGFGTGLNALLTVQYSGLKEVSVNYYGLEAYPLEHEITRGLNYPDFLGQPDAEEVLKLLHSSEWGKPVAVREGFVLYKIKQKLGDYSHLGGLLDLVYFDAFGPEVQPELWTEEIFQKIAAVTNAGGILVTYSCKGSVKRALKSAGFEIVKLPGPKGKREILRAMKF